MILRTNPGARVHFIPGININVITPMGAAAVSWWLAGGISAANCVAAYQAKGSSSYAASKVNLNQPGTNDATDGTGYPTWDPSTGWSFNGIDQYLSVGVTVGDHWSFYIRCSPDYSFNTSNAALFGMTSKSTTDILKLRYDYGSGVWVAYYGNLSIFSGVSPANAVFSIVNTAAYNNTTSLCADLSGTMVDPNNRLAIGAVAVGIGDSFNGFMKETVQAFACYDIDTTSKHADIVAAMLTI
jgi:hypothetical protein